MDVWCPIGSVQNSFVRTHSEPDTGDPGSPRRWVVVLAATLSELID